MKVVVLQSNYIPWKGYFDLIHQADLFIFYDEVKYTKNDWRNRNKIYPKNGLQWLTIPVPKNYVHHKISEVTFASSQWQDLHFKSLFYGYRGTSYFGQLEEVINDYLLDKKWKYLKELNHYLIKLISKKIGIGTEFRDSSEFQLEGDKIHRLLDLLVQAKASEYISGPSGKNYLQPYTGLFEEKGITIHYKHYPEYKVYTQQSTPFQQNVSILDMIANLKYEEIGNYIWK